jgi:16S rRNA (adenine1518-N6/adenine1519-N6)-dimethyltransferase
MTIYRPSELRDFLSSLGIHPKKSLSQNFLTDRHVIERMCDAAEVASGDLVVEVGPGPGAVTEELLARGAKVIAIERDETLAKALSRLKGDLTIISGDVLEQDLIGLVGPGQAKLVASLPYHITTPILTHFLPTGLFSKMAILIQEEVARRFTAVPGNKQFGSITLFLQCYATAHYVCRVSRNCFYPVPGVDSAIIALVAHTPPYSEMEPFHDLVRTAFGQRRKMISKSLSSRYPNASEALTRAGIAPTLRPEQLSLAQFLKLFDEISSCERGE